MTLLTWDSGGVGGLLAINDVTNGVHFAAFDGNGNLTVLLGASDGTVSANYEYGPFGEVLRATGPLAKVNPISFSTKYQDDETDLLYYGYRYYNAALGRWESRDPAGGVNLYAFVRNSPVYGIDYLGLLCECAKNMTIQNVRKINRFQGIGIFGHSFEVAIDLDYSKGDGSPTLEWWEKADVVPDWYGGLVKANEWADLYPLFGGTGLFATLNDWDKRDKSTEGSRHVIIHDSPEMGILSGKAVKRTTLFKVVVKNPKCCCSGDKPLTVTAKQILSTDPENPTKITTQEFTTP